MAASPCLVAIGAHAADVEFSAGAAILKHVRNGWQAHLIHLTLGEKGSPRLSPEEYGAQKRREAEAAAEILGGVPHFLPYRDGELQATDEVAAELAKLLRTLQPQVVITHWRESIHTDHTAAYHLSRRALFMASNPHFELEGLGRMGWVRLYHAENWEDAEGFRAYTYLDISDVMSDWERAFRCYAIGRGEGGFPYWDWYQAQTRLRGIRLGVAHAEAFAIDESAMYVTKGLL
jgi:LmbE family N-acetylglucosaminyl deacetylase